MRTRLTAWDKKSAFEYNWNTDGAITIFYGDNFEYSLILDGQVFDLLIRTFAGKEIRVNHCLAEENMEDWLKKNHIGAGISRYVAPVLLHEGRAREGPRQGTITFT
jgi:hypothetical protein